MNARNRTLTSIAVLLVVTCLALAGCQAADKEPEREIVYEKDVNCPVINFVESTVDPAEDPELGTVFRAYTHEFELSCSEPYIAGRIVAVLDGYIKSDSTSGWWGYYELVTKEGGVWKGNCDTIYPTKTTCIALDGEGIYEGLQLDLESELATGNIKFTVTRLPEAEE